MRYIRWLVLFGLILLFTGCDQKGWQRLSEGEVRRLLPKYMLLISSFDHLQSPDSIRQVAYDSFFSAEGYTTIDWDSTIAWYAKHEIELLFDIYRQVDDSLTLQRDNLQAYFQIKQAQQDHENAKTGYIVDSINLLNLGDRIYQGGDLVNQSVEFIPSIPYSNVELELSVRMLGLPVVDTADALQMELCLSSSDSSMVERHSIISDGWHQFRVAIPSSKSVYRVRAILRGILPDSLPQGFVWLDSLRLVRYPLMDHVSESQVSETLEVKDLSVDAQEWAESEVL